ncbi:MAG: DUF4189 domain-containing protein [Alphaproteobacteria bacterium]|nr:DUF4189 domain-containing protein [Alphaproteobacteria bacterium]
MTMRFAVPLTMAIVCGAAIMPLPSRAQSSGAYGAIASTKSHYRMGYGIASGHAGEADAVAAAVADCEMRAGMRGVCEKHVSFKDRCAAVAEGDDHTGAAEMAASRDAAERMAVAMCQAGGTHACKIVQSFCAS